jgi:hypothetical protein
MMNFLNQEGEILSSFASFSNVQDFVNSFLEVIVGWIQKAKQGEHQVQRGIDLANFLKVVVGRIDMYFYQHHSYLVEINFKLCDMIEMLRKEQAKGLIKNQSWMIAFESMSISTENEDSGF